MGQMFDKTHDQMTNWRWDNLRAVGDQVDCSNLETTSLGKVKRTVERSSWYACDDPRAKIEQPSCCQYEPGDFLGITPLNWDEIIDEDDADVNCADSGAPSGGRRRPGNGNDNDDGKGEEDTQGGEKETGEGKGTMDGKGKGKATENGKGKGKRKGQGNSKGKGIVKQTPGGDDISRAVALQLQKEVWEADLNTEG